MELRETLEPTQPIFARSNRGRARRGPRRDRGAGGELPEHLPPPDLDPESEHDGEDERPEQPARPRVRPPRDHDEEDRERGAPDEERPAPEGWREPAAYRRRGP